MSQMEDFRQKTTKEMLTMVNGIRVKEGFIKFLLKKARKLSENIKTNLKKVTPSDCSNSTIKSYNTTKFAFRPFLNYKLLKEK